MPNHVSNIVKMKGIKKLPLFSVNSDREQYFDFNKIIPMPENLNVVSDATETIAIEAVMRKLSGRKFFGKNYKTMSDYDYNKEFEKSGKSEEELLEAGLQYISNKVKYGATTWYDWRIINWGTKWNSYSFEFIDDDTIRFETAWNCPEPIVMKLSEMYPETRIEHWWADEDCGNNSGYKSYEDGADYGYYDEPNSSDAYEHYNYCWSSSNCIYQDEEGNYHKYDCDNCHRCG